MQFPDEPGFKDRLALLAKTFGYRIGPLVIVTGSFLANDSPHLRAVGVAGCAWIVFEALVTYRFRA